MERVLEQPAHVLDREPAEPRRRDRALLVTGAAHDHVRLDVLAVREMDRLPLEAGDAVGDVTDLPVQQVRDEVVIFLKGLPGEARLNEPLADQLPLGIEYVPGSLQVNDRAVSDALDGDEAKAAAGREPAEEKNGPYYRIIVAPDRQFIDAADERHSLPANMRVDAYALLDRRPLYQWILQPVYAFGRALHEG